MIKQSLSITFLLLLSIFLIPRSYPQNEDPTSLTQLAQAKGQIVIVYLNNGDVRKGQLIEATNGSISLKVKRSPLYSEDEQISLSEIQKITDTHGNEIKGKRSEPLNRPSPDKEQAFENPESVKSSESNDQDLRRLLDLLGPSENKNEEAKAQPVPEKKEPEPKPAINPDFKAEDTLWAQQEERQGQNQESKILPTKKEDLDLLRISGLLDTPEKKERATIEPVTRPRTSPNVQAKIAVNKIEDKSAGTSREKKKTSPTSPTNLNQQITELPREAETQRDMPHLSETLQEMRSSIKQLNTLINRLTNLTIVSIMGLASLIGFTLWRQKRNLNLFRRTEKQRDSQLPIRVIKLQGTQAIADEGAKGGLQVGETLTVMRRTSRGLSDIGMAQVVKVTDHTSRIKFVEKLGTTSFKVGDVLSHNGHRTQDLWKQKLVQLSQVIKQRLNFIPVKKSKGKKKKRTKLTLL